MIISDLIQDGGFESGNLELWTEKNACIIDSPNVSGGFAALLSLSKLASSFISQIVNVVPLESYRVSLSLAKDGTRSSKPVHIRLEYLDNTLNEIEGLGLGLDITVQGNELPNGKEGTFKVIEETTEIVPLNGRFARLTIERAAGSVSGIIIDQVSLLRVSEVSVTEIPKFYVANTGEDTVTAFTEGLPQSITVVNSPQAMLYLNVSGEDRVYVAGEQGVSVIDVSTNTVTTTIDIMGTPAAAFNKNILASSDSSTLYLTSTSGDEGFVTVIDTATNTVTASIVTSPDPMPLALTSPTGLNPNLLFVGILSGELVIIDTTPNTIQSTVSVAADPCSLLLTPSEELLIIGVRSVSSNFQVYQIPTGVVNDVSYDLSATVRTESLLLSSDNERFYMGLQVCESKNVGGIYGFLIAAYDIFLFNLLDDLGLINSGIAVSSSFAQRPLTLAQIPTSDETECLYADVIGFRSEDSLIRQYLFSDDTLSQVTSTSATENSGFLTLSSDNQFILTSLSETNQVQVIDVATFSTILKVAVGDTPVVIVEVPSDRDNKGLGN